MRECVVYLYQILYYKAKSLRLYVRSVLCSAHKPLNAGT